MGQLTCRFGGPRSQFVVGGTGAYENASGLLHTHGIANVNEGTLILRYDGRICLQ